MLKPLSKEEVENNGTLQQNFGEDRFKYNWFTDKRNPKLFMPEYKLNSDKSVRVFRMPNNELYRYLDN
jgi:hypothetical protein